MTKDINSTEDGGRNREMAEVERDLANLVQLRKTIQSAQNDWQIKISSGELDPDELSYEISKAERDERNSTARIRALGAYIRTMVLNAKLWIPADIKINLMPPVPGKVPIPLHISVFLSNYSKRDEELVAATPCDIHSWEIYDADGRLIQSEPPELCPEVIVKKTIYSGETIRSDNTMIVNGKLLQDGERYIVRYRFWGVPCEGSFTAHVIV